VHLGEWHHVHCYLVEVYVQIALKTHAASEVVYYIRHNRVFLLEIICFFFCVASLKKGAAFFNRLLLFFLLHFCVLSVDTTDDVEKSLVVNRKNTVCVFN